MLVAIGTVLRLIGVGTAPLWLDEALSWNFASHTVAQIWSWAPTLDTANPPLYYTMLHAWLLLGDSAASLRLLSVLASVAVIPVIFALGKVIGGPRLGLLAALLATISPIAVRYAQEARTYALLLLAATLVMWSLARLIAQPDAASQPIGAGLRQIVRSVTTNGAGPRRSRSLDSAWLIYILAAASALLLHDTAFLLLVGANVVVVLWLTTTPSQNNRAFLRNWCVAQFAVILLWLPWLPGFLQQTHEVQANFWIPFPTASLILQTAYELLASRTFITVPVGAQWVVAGTIGAALVGLAITGLWALRTSRKWLLLVVVLMGFAPAAEVAISVLRPLLLGRTLIWTTVPLELAFAAGLLWLRPGLVRGVALSSLIMVSGWGLWNYLTIPQKEAWDQTAAYIANHATAGDGVLFGSASTRVPFDYYFRTSGKVLDEGGLPRDMPTNQYQEEMMRPSDEATVRALASAHPRVWLVWSTHAAFTDPSGLIPTSIAQVDDLVAAVPFTGGVELYLYVRRGAGSTLGPPSAAP